jgi:hypothetical protein
VFKISFYFSSVYSGDGSRATASPSFVLNSSVSLAFDSTSFA